MGYSIYRIYMLKLLGVWWSEKVLPAMSGSKILVRGLVDRILLQSNLHDPVIMAKWLGNWEISYYCGEHCVFQFNSNAELDIWNMK